MDAHRKITAGHLAREAYLYVRQSSLRQVLENTESTKRHPALLVDQPLAEVALPDRWLQAGRFVNDEPAKTLPE